MGIERASRLASILAIIRFGGAVRIGGGLLPFRIGDASLLS